jgi:hypothetical protein
MLWAPVMMMDAVLATIDAGGQTVIQLNLEVDEHMLISALIYWQPWTMYAQGCPPLRQCGFIKSTPLEGQAAPSPWWWCLLVVCVVVD